MSVSVSPSETAIAENIVPAPDAPASGRGLISFHLSQDGRTRLKGLRQDAPLRILLPDPVANEPVEAAFTNTGGGMVGGDHVEMGVSVGRRASVLAYAQAAEKIYRSVTSPCVVQVNATVDCGGWLEWLPQETILFDESQLVRRTRLDVGGEGQALCGEMLVFGRQAHGEIYQHGLAHEVWEVRRDGRLVWADALRLEGAVRTPLDHPAGFGAATACATMVAVLDRPDASALDLLRAVPFENGSDGVVRRAFTLVNGIVIGRWLASDTELLRNDFGHVWRQARQHFGGWQDRLPRLWSM